MKLFLKACSIGLVLLFAACTPEQKPPVVVQKPRPKPVPTPVAKEAAKPVRAHVSYLDSLFRSYDLVNIHELDTSIRLDLRYADTTNFLKRDMYDGLENAYFNCITATRLANAQYFLKEEYPGLSLIIFDAARPQHIQQLMWDSLKLPLNEKYNYLSPPYQPSMHNYGCAADVGLLDLQSGKLLDMGSLYDFFGKISEPGWEFHYLKTKELSREAYDNRLILRKAMQRAKFNPIRTEWWHFSICSKEEAVVKYKLIK